MTTFSMLSEIIRAFFALWALLICLFNILNTVLGFTKKKYIIIIFSALLFIASYIFWQVIFDFSLLNKNGRCSNMTQIMVNIHWAYYLLIFLSLSIGTAILLIYNIHYEKNYLSFNSIKTYLDKVDCGVCCYKDNGRVLFSNICINQLCIKISGSPLLNGNQFNEFLNTDLISIENEKWRFTFRNIILNNERLHEIIAINVTNEYNKTQDLEKEKLELSQIKRELEDYNLTINDVVKHQEILQAKINIHDEMNRLMLLSVATESDSVDELNNIFSLWQENALLLSKEVEVNEIEETIKRLNQLAKSLKIDLIWNESGLSLLDKEQTLIFFQAAQEAVANASKHAGANKVTIIISSLNDMVQCSFSNDGLIPQKEIVFSGGLLNLEKIAEKSHGFLGAKVNENEFVLTLKFQKNNPIG